MPVRTNSCLVLDIFAEAAIAELNDAVLSRRYLEDYYRE